MLEDKAEVGLIFQPPRDVRLLAHAGAATAPVQTIVHRRHPLASLGRPLLLSDLADHPGAAMFDSFGLRQQVKAAEISEQVQLRQVLTTNSFKVLWQFAGAGLGYALMAARTSSAQAHHLPEVAVLPMANPILNSSSLQVMTRAGRHLSPAARSLLDHFVKALSDPRWG